MSCPILADYSSHFNSITQKCCPYKVAAEQKARVTYDNILRLSDDPDVNDVIKFLRQREVVHFQRFGEANDTKLSRFYPLRVAAYRGYLCRFYHPGSLIRNIRQ